VLEVERPVALTLQKGLDVGGLLRCPPGTQIDLVPGRQAALGDTLQGKLHPIVTMKSRAQHLMASNDMPERFCEDGSIERPFKHHGTLGAIHVMLLL
jgi:hypothetical protein